LSKIAWFEHFPGSKNNVFCNDVIRAVARGAGFDLYERPYPFKFGEDFGWFGENYPSAMFGLGAGLNSPALHHADYDFPEEIIETGVRMFVGVIERHLGSVA
jgi:metal-dependent amidase/aminoacylase/carboxypeptidase family protein